MPTNRVAANRVRHTIYNSSLGVRLNSFELLSQNFRPWFETDHLKIPIKILFYIYFFNNFTKNSEDLETFTNKHKLSELDEQMIKVLEFLVDMYDIDRENPNFAATFHPYFSPRPGSAKNDNI